MRHKVIMLVVSVVCLEKEACRLLGVSKLLVTKGQERKKQRRRDYGGPKRLAGGSCTYYYLSLEEFNS